MLMEMVSLMRWFCVRLLKCSLLRVRERIYLGIRILSFKVQSCVRVTYAHWYVLARSGPVWGCSWTWTRYYDSLHLLALLTEAQ